MKTTPQATDQFSTKSAPSRHQVTDQVRAKNVLSLSQACPKLENFTENFGSLPNRRISNDI